MKRRVSRTLLLALAIALAGAAAPPVTQAALWPMLGGSRARTAASSFRGPQTSELAWSFAAKGPIQGGAAVDIDGSVCTSGR